MKPPAFGPPAGRRADPVVEEAEGEVAGADTVVVEALPGPSPCAPGP
ncbi:MAG: hypothetical protein ACREID_02595 [Planctomycetota bacterium]